MKPLSGKTVCRAAVAVFLSLGTAAWSAAPPADKTLAPYFFVPRGDRQTDRMPLKKTSARVVVNGVIAEVTVVQEYRNEGRRPIHARYVFPASTRAAVHGMVMTVGEQAVRAVVKERREARRTFAAAAEKGQGASLLEQQRPNVFTMDVANILPGDGVRVELSYTELLVPTDGVYRFVFPAVTGPRYSGEPESRAPAGDLWVKNPYLKAGGPPPPFHLELDISAGLPLYGLASPSHEVRVSWKDPTSAAVALDPADPSGGDRDFILEYRLTGGAIESGLMLFSGENENFFLLMAQPPARVEPADIPPREFVFVVDVSGSMHGFPLDTAKELLRDLIRDLKPTDRFNVILFAGGSEVLSPVSLPADAAHVAQATRFIASRRGGGGTELCTALEKALALPAGGTRARTVLVITDGYVSAEKEAFRLIRRNLGRANLFAFGIGSAVNRYLVEGLAHAGLGEPFVVTHPGEAAGAAERFRNYVAAPVLTDVRIAFDGFEVYDLLPETFPDLLARRPVIALGKWRGAPTGTIRITGNGAGGPFSRELEVAGAAPSASNSALPYLWARTRLADLSDFGFRADDPDARGEVTALGLAYNLLTAHTSFVAVLEEIRNPGGGGETVSQPLALPRGVTDLAVGGTMAKVPEPGLALLLALLAVLALAGRLARGRR